MIWIGTPFHALKNVVRDITVDPSMELAGPLRFV